MLCCVVLFKLLYSNKKLFRKFQYQKLVKILVLGPDQVQKQPPEVFYRKNFPKNFAIFTGKCLQCSPFLKKRIRRRCFFVNIAKFLAILKKNTCERVILWVSHQKTCISIFYQHLTEQRIDEFIRMLMKGLQKKVNNVAFFRGYTLFRHQCTPRIQFFLAQILVLY